MKKRILTRTAGIGTKLLLSLLVLLLALTGCNASDNQPEIIVDDWGEAFVRFDSFEQIQAFYREFSKTRDEIFYLIDPNQFDGTELCHYYQAMDADSPLTAPYQPTCCGTSFTVRIGEKEYSGYLSVNFGNKNTSIALTEEEFSTRTYQKLGVTMEDVLYAVIVNGDIDIARITCDLHYPIEVQEEICERVIAAMVIAK